MRFDYPTVNSPEADLIVDQALGTLELAHEQGRSEFEHDEEELILEAALIISSRRNKPKDNT